MGSDKTSNVGIEGEKIGLASKWVERWVQIRHP
jgi:hypothetical protein